MRNHLLTFTLLSLLVLVGHTAFAQSASALQAEQVATKNYLANPTVENKNILLSAINTVNSQAQTSGNTTQSNAQAIEQAALAAYNGTPPPAPNVNSMNSNTQKQVIKTGTQVASVVAKGGSCAPTTNNGSELPCATGLECDNNGICNPTPKSGSVQIGGWCGSNDSACLGGGTCDNNGMCVAAAAAPASTAAAPSTNTGSGNFVPLTNLPIFGNSSSLTSAPTIPKFFNALYVYCVGIAAVLAVLQLIHAGILYMGGDSVTEVKQAKDLIASVFLGLILVLSPVIIFSLINPKILSLNVGFDKLQSTSAPSTPAATP